MAVRNSLLLALVVLAGCSPALSEDRAVGYVPRPMAGDVSAQMLAESSISRHVIEAPAKQAWIVLPEVYRRLEIPLGMYEDSLMVLGNQEFSPKSIDGRRMSFYLDCASGGVTGSFADSFKVTMFLVTRLEPVTDDQTLIRTEVFATAAPRAVTGNPSHCTSRGVLERRIWEEAVALIGD